MDEIAAAHINADLIVHYGVSCLSKPSRISTWFVFDKRDLDIRDCIEKLGSVIREDQVIRVIHDVSYDHRIDEFISELRKQFPHVSHRFIPRWYLRGSQGSQETSTPEAQMPFGVTSTLTFVSAKFDDEISSVDSRQSLSSYQKQDILLYIGGESRLLTNLLMMPQSIATKIHAYNPETKQLHTSNDLSSRWMMRR